MNALFAPTSLFADAPLMGLFWGLFSGEPQVRGGIVPWAAIPLGLIAVAAVVVLYAKEAGRLTTGQRLLITGVRAATLVVVAFLLMRPVWVSDKTGERPRTVAVLIDVSQSMDQKDPRPNPDDQWRAALAFDLLEPGKPLPVESAPDRSRTPERPSRLDVARAALTNPRLDLLNKLKKIGPLEISTFGTSRTGRDSGDTAWIKTVTADQPRTALVSAALELLNRDENEQPAAVVLVTDGRENASDKGLAELAERYRARRIPLHIYGVGSSSFGQLRLRDASVPESVFIDDTVAIPVRYAVRGVREGTVDIVAKFGDREVAAKRGIPVRAGDDLREVLAFVPSKEDSESKKQEVTVTVTVTPGGAAGIATDTLTDSTTKPTQVITKKLKVLVVEGLPRKDFQFLQRALLRDRRVDARFFLTEGDREAMKSGYPWLLEFTRQLNGTLSLEREEFRKLINEYDLLILGDVPGKFFSREQQQVIKEFVAEGGGMVHIAGKWNGPTGWLSEESGQATIADVLPVELKPVKFAIQPPQGRYYQPFVPALAPTATRNPLVTLEDDPLDNGDLWGRVTPVGMIDTPPAPDSSRTAKKQLQPIEWYYPVMRLKPGAEAFLVHPTARTPEPDNRAMPLLAGHYYGKGYVLFCAFDDTWRWRFNEADRYFGRFWSQCVYLAGVPRALGTKLTQVSLDTLEPIQGKSGQIYARVLDENFKPYTAEEIDATLEKLDADPNDQNRTSAIKLRKLHGQDGEFVAPLPFNQFGRFKLTVTPNNKSPANLEYRVNLPPDHEQAPGGLAELEMMKLAADSGAIEQPGKFYHEEDLFRLPNEVKPQYTKFTRRDEIVLWNKWWMGLLICLLSLEWFLRKFCGLS
ncbi:Uncharacterized protein OS=Chthoniobacter flavus Ellin428 GN=CfE428DRAFT_2683 PE=4 SV=1: VWA_2: DUF1355 [Gemmata massiliana]|uniref:VWFA domain-containing protein n=1 Tax=Gemmata massiliana TaxID=1210884 RepID=A0A6P2DHV2_9BACT|nr:hypothetical protein [Gemmata massiliana]VTR99660.1 Uncharacterized protein OS=Chthoniobacter flavus Ellin428 GN=CfE428DRAFT_2683 PE=4 SV=1: VWA_2: DUF1355 [Gemmata massiliana]